MAGGRITKESWKLIATEIINIVESDRDYGLDVFTIYDLEMYLTDKGIINVIKDEEN